MKNFKLFLLITFSFFHQSSFACTCTYPPSFSEGIVNSDGDIYADLVLRGTITAKIKEKVEVKVDQIIFGNTPQSTITVGVSVCGYPPQSFKKGDEYILALSTFRSSDYIEYHHLIICKVSYLKIENEIIKGRLAPGIESLKYSDLGTLKNDGDEFNLFSIEHSLSISQNPVADILNIKNFSLANSGDLVQIDVINMIGKKLYSFKKEDGILANDTWTIDLKDFRVGVYFFKLTAYNQETIFKIVKQ
ncbi:MAG: hypothetical protein ACJAT4_000686 [Granulosicoccus sp.]|jgi:hypothetical protein